MSKISRMVGSIKLGAKRNAPELLLGLGLVTGTACVITGAIAGSKQGKINELKSRRVEVAENLFVAGGLTEEELKKEYVNVYSKYALDLAKNYAVPAGLYAATVASIFSSYKIQKNRQIALSTALAAATTAYSTLVSKLKNGAAAGLTAQEVVDGVEVREVVNPETGEVTMEKFQGEGVDSSIYKFRFDQYTPCWEKDKFQNECTLKSEENWANDMLRLNGFLFLNDVLDRLGLPKTKAGQIVGWIANGEGDGYVSFGIEDLGYYQSEEHPGIDLYHYENAFDLNFNCDGDILSKFGN